MDVIQELIDNKIAQFILTGSSARKLKHGQDINLLPGRVLPFYLDPLHYLELTKNTSPILNELLIHGSLPEIYLTKNKSQKK